MTATPQLAWREIPLSVDALVRSSNSLAVLDGKAYIFGGERVPRSPIDNVLYAVDLETGAIERFPDGPTPRVGAGLVAHDGALWLWGGRGGKDMTPLPGSLHRFDTRARAWSVVETASSPVERSYHVLTTYADQLIVHAGCPAAGRLASLSALTASSGGGSTWSQLPDAPAEPRGGTALATVVTPDGPVLARYGGFAGYEVGGPLHLYSSAAGWIAAKMDGDATPQSRSVHGFVGLASPLRLDDPSDLVAVLFYGEGDPAPAELGHDGAGIFRSDVWGLIYRREARAWSWTLLQQSGDASPRGWFGYAPWHRADGRTSIVLQGGLNARNERLGDLWVLDVSV